GAHRRGAPLAVGRTAVAGTEARPGHAAREAAVVEPGRIVAGETCGKSLGLPGTCRCAETLELCHHLLARFEPRHPRVVPRPLPGEEKAQEVAGRHRLDLGP